MRTGFQKLVGSSQKFHAKYIRDGTRDTAYGKKPTMVFAEIRNASTGEIVSNHAWIPKDLEHDHLNLQRNDVVEMEATISEYWKGTGSYKSGQPKEMTKLDYRLNVTALRVIKRSEPVSFRRLPHGKRKNKIWGNGGKRKHMAATFPRYQENY
jgi:hypothetical protein